MFRSYERKLLKYPINWIRQAAWEMAITAMDATAQPTPMPRCDVMYDDNHDRNG